MRSDDKSSHGPLSGQLKCNQRFTWLLLHCFGSRKLVLFEEKIIFIHNLIQWLRYLWTHFKTISYKPAFKSAVKNYLKITARNRELDDFSYDFNILCV